jgi:hypothetical protein
MHGALNKFFTEDHRRLESLLEQAFIQSDHVDEVAYIKFRTGLLKHIGQEEKILIPALNKIHENQLYPPAAKLRLEHGAIAALLVLPPSAKIKNVLLGILQHHNVREESEKGLYTDCDCLLVDAVETMLDKVHHYPDVPVMHYNNTQHAHDAARRAVTRAGYDFDQLANTSIPKNNNVKDE